MTHPVTQFIWKIIKNRRTPTDVFQYYEYQRHNQRRLEHLASLGLNIAGNKVLEVGAGIGDHTSFFLDRHCDVVSTDARQDNLAILKSRYPNIQVRHLNMDDPDLVWDELFDIVYCYGLLYHLEKPAQGLEYLARYCRGILLLESVVSFGNTEVVNPCKEDASDPSQSFSGHGCRPTRIWIYNQLKSHFEFVYLPLTQPNHDEFPIDWNVPPADNKFSRAVFIASRQPLINQLLTEDIPIYQRRH